MELMGSILPISNQLITLVSEDGLTGAYSSNFKPINGTVMSEGEAARTSSPNFQSLTSHLRIHIPNPSVPNLSFSVLGNTTGEEYFPLTSVGETYNTFLPHISDGKADPIPNYYHLRWYWEEALPIRQYWQVFACESAFRFATDGASTA